MKKSAGILFLLLMNAVVLGLPLNPAQAHWSAMTNSSTESLWGVWGSSPTNVFAVGNGGTILHYNGSTWSSMLSGAGTFTGIWGSSASNVYAVGGGMNATIRKYDGENWLLSSYIGGETFNGIWGSSEDNIYAVGGGNATILKYSGTDWNFDYIGAGTIFLNGIWGSAADNIIYAVGTGMNATILKYSGVNWIPDYSGIDTFNAIWGSSSTDIFTVSEMGAILHSDGSTWSSVYSGGSGLNGIWGSSATDVFAVGGNASILHYDGSTWSSMSGSTMDLYSIWGSSCTDVFAVGYGGEILHYDGEALTVEKTGTGSGTVASDTAGIDCGSDCTYQYCNGATVTLTATADTGSAFAGWSGGGCSGTGQCVLTITDNTTVSANFIDVAPPTTTTAPVSTTTTAAVSTTTTAAGGSTTTTASEDTTTTTTASGSTTTTTACPAAQALGADNPQLENLRAFRDSNLAHSAVGRQIIQIYYNNAAGINAALERSPALRAVTRRALEALAPVGKAE